MGWETEREGLRVWIVVEVWGCGMEGGGDGEDG